MQQIVSPNMAVQRHGGRQPAGNRHGSKHVLGAYNQMVWMRTPSSDCPLQEDAPCLLSGSNQVRLEDEGQAGSTWNNVQSLSVSDSWASLDPNDKVDSRWSTIRVPTTRGLRSTSIRCPRRCIEHWDSMDTANKELLSSASSSAGGPAALELEWQVVVERQAEHPLSRYLKSSYAPQQCRPDLDEDGFVPVQGSEDDGSEEEVTSEGMMMEQENWYPDRDDEQSSRMLWNGVHSSSFASTTQELARHSRSSVWWRTASTQELAALVARQAQHCLENCDLPAATADAVSNTSGDYRSRSSEGSAWWRTAGEQELAALVAQKAADCLENCDLPTPPQKTSWQRRRRAATSSYDEYSLSESVDSNLLMAFHKSQQSQVESLGLPAPLVNIVFGNTSMSVAPGPPSLNGPAVPSSPEPPQSLSSGWKECESLSSLSTSWCGEEEGEGSCLATEPGLLGQALCHSQTRARKAEKEARQARKAAEKASREREQLAHMFCREAATLTYYRRRVTSLEAENLCLRQFCQTNPLWIDNSTFNPVKALDHLSRYHWKNSGKEPTIRYQLLEMPDRRQSSVKLKSDGSCVVMESTVGLAFTLGLTLAGAGLMLGWSMR